MAGAGRKWLIGCGAGCGGLLVLVILVVVGGGVVMMRPLNAAVDAQRALDERFGARDAYVPPAAGVTAERLAAFLAVRREIMPVCGDFAALNEHFRAMDDLGKRDEEPDKAEMWTALSRTTGSVLGLPKLLGDFARRRNEALLAQGMGLGEYVWIYTLVYHSWLEHPVGTAFDDAEGGNQTAADRALLGTLARAHADALREAGFADEAAAWEAEAAGLGDAPQGVPFGGGRLPAAQAAVFAPHRAELEALFCPPLAAFELDQMRRKGLTVHAD